MVWLRKSIIWAHRYLGMVLSLLFLMWFVTGIGMIYSRGMPRLTPELRLARLSPLDLTRVRLTPSEAAERAEMGERLGQVVLLTVMDRPAYRFTARGSVTVFADTGELLLDVDPDQARTIASRFMNLPSEDDDKVHYASLITEPDQWTLTQGRQLPLHKISVDDAAHTELYVSSQLGEVVQITTRSSRALAWVSTIPHFLYFAPLRLNGELWNQVVLWASGLGCILALLGIVLGIIHFKPSRPFRLARISSYIPYTGWMRWHYIAGLVFGVLTLTWVFSGLLSMEPFEWTTADESLEAGTRQAFPGGPADLSQFPAIGNGTWEQVLGGRPIKEVEFVRIFDDPHYIVRSAPELPVATGWPDGGHQPYYVMRGIDPERFVIAANPFGLRRESLSAEAITGRLRKAIPGAPIIESQLLSEYDSYYYSRDRQAPLPVLRVKFDDPDKTWLYIDPEISQLVGRVNRMNRAERWLYNGLHSLDFSFWYYKRPLWDIGVIVLSLGGAALSGIGVLLGIKRALRALRGNNEQRHHQSGKTHADAELEF